MCSRLFVDCFLTKFGVTVQWKFPFLPTVCLSTIFGLSSLCFSLSLSLLSSFLFQLSSVLPFVRVSTGWRGRRGRDPDEGDRCVGDRWRKSSCRQLGSWGRTVLYPAQPLWVIWLFAYYLIHPLTNTNYTDWLKKKVFSLYCSHLTGTSLMKLSAASKTKTGCQVSKWVHLLEYCSSVQLWGTLLGCFYFFATVTHNKNYYTII